jgi:hypothetical protein
MDVARNFIATELLNGGDGSQFNTQLTGIKTSDQREVFDEVHQSDEEDNDSDDEEDDLDGAEGELEEEECPVSCACGKSSRHPNKMMESKIKILKEKMKDKSDKTTIKHFYRDEHVVSTKLEDYLSQFVLTWDPLKIMNYSKKLVCWDKKCNGGAISVKALEVRSVEDMQSNGFIIYPRYFCGKCKRTKSSLVTEDLMQMGVPCYVIRRCPVVVKKKTAYTQDLVDSILTMMTGSLGAEQIANIIKAKRSSFWSAHAIVYLEVMADMAKNSLQNFGFTAPPPVGFPTLLSHCDGYGGNTGVSKQAIQRLFIGMSKVTAAIGDRVMMSLGAQVISGDHTFNVPSRIKTRDKANNTYAPIEGLHGCKYLAE